MINKLFNWVGGGFFRTLGRFLAFIALGFLASVIISKNDIQWTDLLGIEMVKADTLKQQSYTQYSSASNLSDTLPTRAWYGYQYFATTPYAQSNFVSHDFYLKSTIDVRQLKGVGKVTIPLYYQVPRASYSQNTDTIEPVQYCRQFVESNGIYTCQTTGINDESLIHDYEFAPTNIQLYALAFYDNGSFNYCQINGTTLECTIAETQQGNYITSIRIYALTYTPYQTAQVEIGLSQLWSAWITDSSVMQGEIHSQTQQQQQQHNETMSYFQDSNTTEADSEATNFFGNFTSQDNGGISSIITAPLSAISGLVSASCHQIVLPIPYLDNKELVLPCMSAIYTEHFGAFFTIYQTIIFGAIAYRIVVSLFMMIQGFKNPDDDKIEVVDL